MYYTVWFAITHDELAIPGDQTDIQMIIFQILFNNIVALSLLVIPAIKIFPHATEPL